MTKRYSYTAHNICLIAVFILASGALSVPYGDYSSNSTVAFLAAAVSGIAALIISAVCINFILSRGEGVLSRVITVLGCAILLFAAVLSTVDAVLSFWQFAADVMLTKTSQWVILVIFAAVTLVFGFSRESALLKFSLVTAVLNAAVILLLLIYSLGQLSFKNLFVPEITIGKDFFAQVFKYFGSVFLPAVSALTFIALKGGRVRYISTVSGTSLGAVLLTVCLAQGVMIFGQHIAATTDYPYMTAVSTVTTGSLFTRPDGFAYVMFFSSYTVKAGVSVSAAVMLIKRMIKKSPSVGDTS